MGTLPFSSKRGRTSQEQLMRFVSDTELATFTPAEQRDSASPIPTQVISNGEFTPLPQSEDQRRVEARISDLAEELAPEHGLSRRGLPVVGRGHVRRPSGHERSLRPDLHCQSRRGRHPPAWRTHVQTRSRSNSSSTARRISCATTTTSSCWSFSADFAKKHWNPDIAGADGLTRYKFQNYVKEIFIDSDTKVAMISGTPTDDYAYLFLTNDQIASARDVVNKVAGSRRCLGHGIVTPGTPGWFEESRA
jgi:hypothetical protein